ncbi:hypothetical protein NC651_004496 [Populus alba x Populus x berolinensis]|nr:hypothetical protein NC651_004496 [Populus alba x Populus x berolinensis]
MSQTQVWFIIYSLITILVGCHSGLELVDCLSSIYSLTKMHDHTKLQSRISIVILIPPCFAA